MALHIFPGNKSSVTKINGHSYYLAHLGENFYVDINPNRYEERKPISGKALGLNSEDKYIIIKPHENIVAHTKELFYNTSDVEVEMSPYDSHEISNYNENQGKPGYCNKWSFNISNTCYINPVVLKVGMPIIFIGCNTEGKNRIPLENMSPKLANSITWTPKNMFTNNCTKPKPKPVEPDEPDEPEISPIEEAISKIAKVTIPSVSNMLDTVSQMIKTMKSFNPRPNFIEVLLKFTKDDISRIIDILHIAVPQIFESPEPEQKSSNPASFAVGSFSSVPKCYSYGPTGPIGPTDPAGSTGGTGHCGGTGAQEPLFDSDSDGKVEDEEVKESAAQSSSVFEPPTAEPEPKPEPLDIILPIISKLAKNMDPKTITMISKIGKKLDPKTVNNIIEMFLSTRK